jgi:hypothetical protein
MAPHARWKGGTTDELRIGIDSGRTADKVDGRIRQWHPLGPMTKQRECRHRASG